MFLKHTVVCFVLCIFILSCFTLYLHNYLYGTFECFLTLAVREEMSKINNLSLNEGEEQQRK